MPDGRSIIPLIDRLLRLPSFAVKVATKDWHPPEHVSFARNHAGGKQPFTDTTTVTNPHNPAERYTTRLWPAHCVQGTPGAELVAELADALAGAAAHVVEKGTDARVEMYSAFYDPLRSPRVCDTGLAARLRGAGVTDVYVVGLAGDYCVRSTAEDAVREGFAAYVVEEATRPVDKDQWEACKAAMREAGVKVVSKDSWEVQRLFAEGEKNE